MLLNLSEVAFFLLVLGVLLYQIDRQYFTAEKNQIIRSSNMDIFPVPQELTEQGRRVLAAQDSPAYLPEKQKLASAFEQIVHGTTSIYSFQLSDARAATVLHVEDSTKPARMNTWKNCLFLRSFDGLSQFRMMQPVPGREGEQQVIGRLTFHYATPPNQPASEAIELLTRRYRKFAAAAAVIWAAIFYLFHRYLLRPMQRVTSYLERSKGSSPTLIPGARHPLEAAYNTLATRALLQQLEERLHGLVRRELETDARETILREALDFVREAFKLDFILLAEISTRGDSFAVTQALASPSQDTNRNEEIAARAKALLAGREAAALHDGGKFIERDAETFEYIAPIYVTGAAVFILGKLASAPPDRALRMREIERACNVLHRGLVSYRVHQRDVFRQRSEANIVLSKNLGHDLTNIIATSKLHLMAVKQLCGDAAKGAADGKAAILRESVEGLVRSTHFLQEIVNIYRSFSYVKKPQFERHDLNTLVAEFLDAFEPSISSRVVIRRDFQPDIPTLILEPRLLKLALFNLLTNALDAMKRDRREGAPSPLIIVRTLRPGSSGEFRLEIEDNGPGIRSKEGRLLSPGEIEAIFDYGFSTKAESSEGLGLNWVKTIIEEFHAGKVSAENVASGGAKFILVIHSMEAVEARI